MPLPVRKLCVALSTAAHAAAETSKALAMKAALDSSASAIACSGGSA
jgi:hypothetical protein